MRSSCSCGPLALAVLLVSCIAGGRAFSPPMMLQRKGHPCAAKHQNRQTARPGTGLGIRRGPELGCGRLQDRQDLFVGMMASIPAVEVGDTLRCLRDMASPEDKLPDARKLELLVGVLTWRGQQAVCPKERKALGLHPLVMPLTRDPETNSITGLLKMPLKPATELPVVRTKGKGLELLGTSIDLVLKRVAIEEDHASSECSAELVRLVREFGIEVVPGASKESSLGLERYILVKAGPFSDLYEWLAQDWLSKGKTEEALITCSRAAGLLPDWGKHHWIHSETLAKVGGRELECRDCARATLQMPLWTVGDNMGGVVDAAETTLKKMISSYTKWAETGGPEEDFVNSSRSEAQIALGRANYLMDTVMLDDSKTWDTIREQLASHYDAASLPEFGSFVRGD